MDLTILLVLTSVISVTLQTHSSTERPATIYPEMTMRPWTYSPPIFQIKDGLFGGVSVPGTIGGTANITYYYVGSSSYYTGTYYRDSPARCSFSNTSFCNVTFYRNKVAINITSDLRYSVHRKSGNNVFCPLTTDSNTIVDDIQKDNDASVDYNAASGTCIALTLTIENITTSDFSNNYSCSIEWQNHKMLNNTEDVVLYNNDTDYTESNIFYYMEFYYVEYYDYDYDRYTMPLNRLFQCGFYNTAVESIKWYIKRDNGTFDDIYSSDCWRSFQIYNVTHQEEHVVETFLLIKDNISPFQSELYCVDTKNPTTAKSATFTVKGPGNKHHLHREWGLIYVILVIYLVIPTMGIILLIFTIIASVRGQVCCKNSTPGRTVAPHPRHF